MCPGISFAMQVGDVEATTVAFPARAPLCPFPEEGVLGYGAELRDLGRLHSELVGSKVDERKRRRLMFSD